MKLDYKLNRHTLPHNFRWFAYALVAILCFFPFITAPIALFLGLVLTLTLGIPDPGINKKASKYLLQISVVGLGFGMNLIDSLQAGSYAVYPGFGYRRIIRRCFGRQMDGSG